MTNKETLENQGYQKDLGNILELFLIFNHFAFL